MVVLLKGYPRLSETFIAQELRGLERAGFRLEIFSMRKPTDRKRHPVHDEIEAPVRYLPEYLHHEPLRVCKALLHAMARPHFFAVARAFLKDLARDISRNRFRRFGQALVLAHEWPAGADWLHVHFIHTPASVGRYAAQLLQMPWTISAHAKDIWTSPDWDLTKKLQDSRWTVTCTQGGLDQLRSLAHQPDKVHLSYHGLDLDRFPAPTRAPAHRDGSDPDDPVALLSVGRAVPKKGFDILLKALALLPSNLCWRFDHVGGGDELGRLKALAADLGLAKRIQWHGSQSQQEVLERYGKADIFVLPCRIGEDGDRDGLPNVLVEAASQRVLCISTTISGIPELFESGENSLLVEPEDPQALAVALETAIRDPAARERMGGRAEEKVRASFTSLVASALAEDGFAVTMVTGGLPVSGFPAAGLDHIALDPAVTSREGFAGLQDADGRPLDAEGERRRSHQLLDLLSACRPDVVITEAFPFGRRQMRFELLPLLDSIKRMRPKPLLFASIRDILQTNKKPGRDEETVTLVKDHFDGVLVHGDPRLTRLEDTFPLAGQIADKLLYTGLVAPPVPVASPDQYRVVVSAGGGAVGKTLLTAAIEARRRMANPGRWCIIAGPNLDEASFKGLTAQASADVEIFRFRQDFRQLLASAELSISQAGYNTVCDILRAGCAALLIPFAAGGETEQTARASKLQALGRAYVIAEEAVTPEAIASGIEAASAQARTIELDLQVDGARQTARLLRERLASVR
eukprot:g25366.t1